VDGEKKLRRTGARTSSLNIEIKIGADLPTLTEGITQELGDLAWQIVSGIEAEAKRLMEHSIPTGRTYRRGELNKAASISLLRLGLQFSKRRQGQVIAGYRFHRASAAGQPPAVDTANLVNSMRAKRTGAMSAELAVNAAYAGYLEPPFAGETEVEGLLNRPFLAPAIDFVLEHVLPTL
jgi:hypothetical protein